MDYDGDGFRVPFIAIGPYVKAGYVTHAQYEQTSILRSIENNFGLAQLAPADARAPDFMDDVNDFHQHPRQFNTFATHGMYKLDPYHRAVDD
jgi:phospholipase C